MAFAFAPIGSVIVCAAIANVYGCKVDEGSAHPCIINGHDYGELLYSLGVMGWFMLVTIPGGLVAFVGWLISYSASRRLAKAYIRRNPSADSFAACNSVRNCALHFSIVSGQIITARQWKDADGTDNSSSRKCIRQLDRIQRTWP